MYTIRYKYREGSQEHVNNSLKYECKVGCKVNSLKIVKNTGGKSPKNAIIKESESCSRNLFKY